MVTAVDWWSIVHLYTVRQTDKQTEKGWNAIGNTVRSIVASSKTGDLNSLAYYRSRHWTSEKLCANFPSKMPTGPGYSVLNLRPCVSMCVCAHACMSVCLCGMWEAMLPAWLLQHPCCSGLVLDALEKICLRILQIAVKWVTVVKFAVSDWGGDDTGCFKIKADSEQFTNVVFKINEKKFRFWRIDRRQLKDLHHLGRDLFSDWLDCVLFRPYSQLLCPEIVRKPSNLHSFGAPIRPWNR